MQTQPGTSSMSRLQWLLLLAVLVLFWLVASPFSLYFLNDDLIHIPLSAGGQLGQRNSVRHVGDLSLWLDSLWSGKDAAGYHITNHLLHFANVILFIFCIQKIADTFRVKLAGTVLLFSGVLFAVYAFHSDAVFWIIGRSASLSMLFSLLCLLMVAYALQHKAWLAGVCITALLAMFAYETAALLPVLLFTWQRLLPDKILRRKMWPAIAASSTILIIYLIIRWRVTGELAGAYEVPDLVQWNMGAIAAKSARLFCRTFLPPMHSPVLFAVFAALALLVVAVVFAYPVKTKRTNGYWWFMLAGWLLSYLPFLSLGVSATGYESERYIYWPSLFFSGWFIYSICLIFNKQKRTAVALMLVVCGYHAFFLCKAVEAYKAASAMSRFVMEKVTENTTVQTLTIRGLPETFAGIPLFRLGLPEGVAWHKKGPCTNIIVAVPLIKYAAGTRLEVSVKDSAGQKVLAFRPAPKM